MEGQDSCFIAPWIIGRESTEITSPLGIPMELLCPNSCDHEGGNCRLFSVHEDFPCCCISFCFVLILWTIPLYFAHANGNNSSIVSNIFVQYFLAHISNLIPSAKWLQILFVSAKHCNFLLNVCPEGVCLCNRIQMCPFVHVQIYIKLNIESLKLNVNVKNQEYCKWADSVPWIIQNSLLSLDLLKAVAFSCRHSGMYCCVFPEILCINQTNRFN